MTQDLSKVPLVTRPITKPKPVSKPIIKPIQTPIQPVMHQPMPRVNTGIQRRQGNTWEMLSNDSRFMAEFNKYNDSIGKALTILKTQPHDIQGREKEGEMLSRILERKSTPVAMLVGPAGVGKTALVEDFVKKIGENKIDSVRGRKYFAVALRIGYLKALGNDALQSALTGMLDELHRIEQLAQERLNDPNVKIVLFIDEVHMLVTIFGPGTKIGGDLIKDVLARSPIRVISATTRREYDATIAVDEPLKERFKEIEMNELSKPIVLQILKNWWASHASQYPMPDQHVFEKIVEANATYRAAQAEPRKSLDILEDLYAYSAIYNKKATPDVVDAIFRDRFSIELTFNFDANDVFNKVKERVKGQTLALYELQRGLRSVGYQLHGTTNRPIMTLLLTGPTGVGKTETTKAIAESLYPGENVLVNINMPDYKSKELEPAFRKRLGEIVRHNPNAIVLLDEFEKASLELLDSMLAILDEGIVHFEVINREGHPEIHKQSLRNTIIVATTNAGSKVFQDDAQFSSVTDGYAMNDHAKAEYDRLRASLENNLKSSGFKPEMLGRFNRIIPYRGLTENIFVEIAEALINKTFKQFKETKGIELVCSKVQRFDTNGGPVTSSDVAAFIALKKVNATDPSSGGARKIRQAVEKVIEDEIIEYLLDHPNSTKFEIYMSRDSAIYQPGASASKGGLVINALN